MAERTYRLGGFIAAAPNQPAPELRATSRPDLPPAVDLSPMCSPVEDQGDIGSCTANSVAGALEYHQILHRQPMTDLSRLFMYYNARRLSGRTDEDSGCSMAEAVAAYVAFGACPEPQWPYNPLLWNTKPSTEAYESATSFGSLQYASLAYGIDLKIALASGLPIIFGMGVPASFQPIGKSGHVGPPSDGNWEPSAGGHAMLIVGYNDAKNAWLVRNSWGTDWGINGYVWIDYRVMDHYSQPQAFWTIGSLERAKYFQLGGVTTQQAVDTVVAHAPPSVQDQVRALKAGIRHDLETHLDTARQGLRDRLRGPGAGGGYNRGPGAGEGYDE